ncbi:MAG: hypothetical protein IPL63_11030 [Saprospiraceae bacterium]|nr:hypothetical protein [Saprospiraceae bacterium]
MIYLPLTSSGINTFDPSHISKFKGCGSVSQPNAIIPITNAPFTKIGTSILLVAKSILNLKDCPGQASVPHQSL